ncbi:MAG: hypothetical protein RLY31_2356 [Bacteroidota bacterium]
MQAGGKGRIMKKILMISMGILQAGWVGAQVEHPAWKDKVDVRLWQGVSEGGRLPCIVLLREQADLGEAAFLPGKREKAGYVYRILAETAERTQLPLLSVLLSAGAPVRSFHIVNAVRTEVDLSLLRVLAQRQEVSAIRTDAPVSSAVPVRTEPGASERSVAWGVTYIHAAEVWAMGYDGTGVVVAGQDTGYDWDHAALKAGYRGWDAGAMTVSHDYHWHDAIHADNPNSPGTNPCGYDSSEPCDDGSHGTHTMGTMVGDDGGSNQVGVAPGATWIGCRNMEMGWGTITTYLECFEWFLAPTDLSGDNPDPDMAPHVVNNSWYCPLEEGCDSSNYGMLETAVENLRAAGVVVVASAGNSGPSCETVDHPPAMFAGSLSVGAVNSSGLAAAFSSRGPTLYGGSTYTKPDLAAPGVNIYSSTPGDNYGNSSGTSMAGPHVAGAVALLLDAVPALAGQPDLVAAYLTDTAVPVTTTDGCGGNTSTTLPNNTYGHGIVHVQHAVDAALTALPLVLLDFRAEPHNGEIHLHWIVSLPGTMNHFETERSVDGVTWVRMGRQVFRPNSAHYFFQDGNPPDGTCYYRLRLVDIDGSQSFSPVIRVSSDRTGRWQVFPNPGDGYFRVTGLAGPGPVGFRVVDATGRHWTEGAWEPVDGYLDATIDLSAAAAGIYFLKVGAAGMAAPRWWRLVKR